MVKERIFQGPWLPSSSVRPTSPGDVQNVLVRGSQWSTQDIFVAAGCQQGFLHWSTAFTLAANMIEAVLELTPSATRIIRATDPKGNVHDLRGVASIETRNSQWSAIGEAGECITGPHNAAGWAFRSIEDATINKLRELTRKEVTNS